MSSPAIRALGRRGAAALIPLLLAGCGAMGRSVVEPPEFGDPAAIITWVNVTPVEFHAGDDVQIEVGIRNPTKLPIKVQTTSSCWLMYVVKDSHDDTVAPKEVACAGVAWEFELAPGDSRIQQFSWTGTESDPASAPLPAGEYRVFSGFHGPGSLPSSTPVTIRILP